MNRKELVIRTTALAGDYFWNVYEDDGTEIIKTFAEYFELIKEEDTIDKSVIGNIAFIRARYLQAANAGTIAPECRNGASRMDLFLQGQLEKMANPVLHEMLAHEGDIAWYYDDIDDLCRKIAPKFQ